MGGGDLRSQLHPDSIWGILNKMGEMQLEGTETGAANGEDWQEEIYQKDEQQESQNSEQYLYNQQLRQHLMKLKFQPGGVPQSIMQSQIQQQLQKQQQQQQQNLLQPNQLQSSQQAVMQNSLWQTPASSTLQIQQSSLQQSTQSLLQQQPQSVHMLQQSEVPVQQQMQPNMANMLPNQGEQSQSQPMQQQLMSQIQSQPGQLQQQMGLQQQANALQRDMPLRIQTSGPLLQQQTTIDQQKQLLQSQRGIPEAPMNSSTQMGNANGGDWQEDIYQKIKSMRMYLPELNEKYQRLAAKVQQHHQHDAIPQQAKNDQLEKLRSFKDTLESLTLFLQHNKRVFRALQPAHKEKILRLEKMVVNMLGSHRPRKPISSLQEGQLAQPHVHPMQQSQQQQSQISQMHTNEGQMNSQMQQMSVQSSVPTTQQNNLTTLQPYSLSSVSSVSNSRQNMMDGMQPGANVDSGQGNAMNQMQQVAMNSLQQNPLSGPQLMNVISMLSQSGLTALQSNVNSFPTNPDILQPQQIKQEQEMFSTQQIKQQYQQQQMQQQYMLRQLLIRQQQQITQQQSTQLLTQQIMQLSQMNDTNDMKMWHHMGGKAGVLQQHNANKQGPYHPQQMKPGTSFSISLQQVLQASSPQIGHHPSPQIDQQNLLSSHTKAGTPLQPANSPFVVQSPSTSMAPSPVPGESEKIASGVTSLSNPGNSVHQPITAASMPNQSLAIGTPGISASPLLAEFSSPDGTHGVASTIAAGNSNVVEQPLERLLK